MESKKLKGVKTETLEVTEPEVPRKKNHFSGTEEAEKQQPPPKLPLASSQKQRKLEVDCSAPAATFSLPQPLSTCQADRRRNRW